MHQSHADSPSFPGRSVPHVWTAVARLVAQRSVRLALVGWLLANLIVLLLGRGTLPFDRPRMAGATGGDQVIASNLAMLEVFLLMGITWALTRRRDLPDIAARAPARPEALRETLLLLGYGVLGLVGGWILGRALGWEPISFHITGTLYGTDKAATPANVAVWALYNLVVYAVVPYLVFHRRYSNEELNLVSSDRHNDILVIVVVLAIESTAQLLALGAATFALTPRQLALGMPLAFAVYFAGTVLPTMIFIYAILAPRYLALTGSAATTVILGGLTYATLHLWDGWTAFDSPRDALLSLIVLAMVYFGPGMMKMVLTLRTANAWVHVWAYHAIAPHTLQDTPLLVKIFQIR